MQAEHALATARNLARAGQHAEARSVIDQLLAITPDHVDALCLGVVVRMREDRDLARAEQMLEAARATAPHDARVHALSAEYALHAATDRNAGVSHALEALRLDPDHISALVALTRLDASRVDASSYQRMRALAESPATPRAKRRQLWNCVGRADDAADRVDQAFAAFSHSNALAPAHYDPRSRERRLAAVRATFTPAFFESRQPHPPDMGADLAFIVGLPRSGSTLLEQALAAHPAVLSAGETPALPDLDATLRRSAQRSANMPFDYLVSLTTEELRAAVTDYRLRSGAGAPADVMLRLDKRLGNFLHLGLVNLIAPSARILHPHRHPLDVCFACFSQAFDGHAYANTLVDLAHFHGVYRGYISHWSDVFGSRLRHCRYESLAKTLPPEMQNVTAWLGLPWDEACAAPHRAGGYVATASAAQVREAPHTKRLGRWRRYEKHLAPLIAALGGLDQIRRLDEQFQSIA